MQIQSIKSREEKIKIKWLDKFNLELEEKMNKKKKKKMFQQSNSYFWANIL